MGMRNFIAMLAALLAAVTLCSKALAQFPYQEPFEGRWSPFIEPDYFNPDYQFFAKAEIDEYGGWPEPNTGFFFSYERLYWNVGRSEFNRPELVPPQGDFTWGNRIEFGYMTHEDYGWLFSIVHLDGPNVVALVDTGQPDPIDPNFNIINEVPVNLGSLNVVEIARTWRLERNYFGGFCELMLGVRYTQFKSNAGNVLLGPFIVEFVDIDGVLQTETVFLDIGDLEVENNMLGGEIGVRWFRHKGRWMLNAETKFIPSANFQFHRGNVRDPQTGLPPLDPSRDEFVPIGELRLGATYELTRDISIGSDFTMMYFGQGIGRGFENPAVGPPDLFNDESLVVAGFSIRLTVNR